MTNSSPEACGRETTAPFLFFSSEVKSISKSCYDFGILVNKINDVGMIDTYKWIPNSPNFFPEGALLGINTMLFLSCKFILLPTTNNEVDLSHCKQRQNFDAKKTHLHLSFSFHLPHGIGHSFLILLK